MLTSLLTFDLEVFNACIVLHDLLLFVNVSLLLNSEFDELLLLFTPILHIFIILLIMFTILPPYWLAAASVILWLLRIFYLFCGTSVVFSGLWIFEC